MPKIVLNRTNIDLINGRPDAAASGQNLPGCHVVTNGNSVVLYLDGEHLFSIVNCQNRVVFVDQRK